MDLRRLTGIISPSGGYLCENKQRQLRRRVKTLANYTEQCTTEVFFKTTATFAEKHFARDELVHDQTMFLF